MWRSKGLGTVFFRSLPDIVSMITYWLPGLQASLRAGLALLVDLRGLYGADAGQHERRRLFFTRARAVPVNLAGRIRHERAGVHRIRGFFVVHGRLTHPPRARDNVGPPIVIVKVRPRKISGIPTDDDPVGTLFGRIAVQDRGLLAALLSRPLEIFGQCKRDVGWTRRRTFRIRNGGTGSRRLSSRRLSGCYADGARDEHGGHDA